MSFAWVSWEPPELSPEAELQLAHVMSAIGKVPFIKRFWGLNPRELPPSEESFFERHAAGLIYLGLILAGFVFLDWNGPAPPKGSGSEPLMIFVAVGWLGAIIFYGSMLVAASRYATWLGNIERKYCVPRHQTPPPKDEAGDDNAYYATVAREIEHGHLDKVIWTRAVANSAGDDNLAKSLYIRYRAQALQEAHLQQARSKHETQVLAREREERQQKEAAARKRDEESQEGCVVAFLVCIGLVFFVAIMFNISESTSQPSGAMARRSPKPPSTPSFSERKAMLARRFTELDAEYRVLLARRANLNLNDPERIAAFNRDATKYTRRAQEARDEKARLEQ